MKKNGSFCIWIVMALLILAPRGWVLAQETESSAEVFGVVTEQESDEAFVEKGSKEGFVDNYSATCHTTLTSGSGSTYMKICISKPKTARKTARCARTATRCSRVKSTSATLGRR